jgi:mannose-6-phosphate isomerase-like protein (cupin superfamily)
MKVRRVVTGQDARGKAVFVSDELVEPITLTHSPGREFHRLWGADATPILPASGTPTPHPLWFPPAGGFRFTFFTLPPQSTAAPADAAARQEIQEKMPGLAEVLEPGNPDMHSTDSVDFGVLLSGEVWLELDDGAEVHLKAGDTFIQNGTRHCWHNRGDTPAVLVGGLIGAVRRP